MHFRRKTYTGPINAILCDLLWAPYNRDIKGLHCSLRWSTFEDIHKGRPIYSGCATLEYYLTLCNTQHKCLIENDTSGRPTILAYRLFPTVKMSNRNDGDGGARGSSATDHSGLPTCVQTRVAQLQHSAAADGNVGLYKR